MHCLDLRPTAQDLGRQSTRVMRGQVGLVFCPVLQTGAVAVEQGGPVVVLALLTTSVTLAFSLCAWDFTSEMGSTGLP